MGQTLLDWPDAFVDALTDAGFRVLAFDNRDVGHSTRFAGHGSPPLLRLLLAVKLHLPWLPTPPYRLVDMAEDVTALLDALGIVRAHLVGVSMGGMIAQRVALAHPSRVASLACIMSRPVLPACLTHGPTSLVDCKKIQPIISTGK